MTEGDIQPVGDSTESVQPRGGRWIATTSRVGLWGFVVALIPAFANYGGGPLWLARLDMLSGVAMISSGIGVLATAVLLLRALPEGPSWVKLAALGGAPLGLLFLMLGGTLLAPLGRLADVTDAKGPLALGLGLLVIVSLLIGFLGGGRHERSEGAHRVDRG